MTLRHIKIFVAVCETMNITLAAENLYLSQPAVSLAIKELEQYYGVRLFDRISKKLFITEKGKNLLNYAIPFLSLFDEMENKISNRDNIGSIRIGGSITIGSCYLPEIVKSFTERNPDFAVKVFINSSDLIEDKLLKCELDFALIEGNVHDGSLVKEKICDDEMIPVVNPSHKLAGKKEITLSEFVSEKFLLREKGSAAREIFDNQINALGQQISPEWESTSTTAIIRAVETGLGISVLSKKLVEKEIKEGKLATFSVKDLRFKRQFSLIYHRNKYLSDFMRVCMELCREQIVKNHI